MNLVEVGHIIDTHLIGDGSVLRTAVIFLFISIEIHMLPKYVMKTYSTYKCL